MEETKPQPLDYATRTMRPDAGIAAILTGLRLIALAIVFLTGGLLLVVARAEFAIVSLAILFVSAVLLLIEYIRSFGLQRRS